MDVTSNHLEVGLPPGDHVREIEGNEGEELSKRGEDFGHPVGKRESTYLIPHPKILMRIYIPPRRSKHSTRAFM